MTEQEKREKAIEEMHHDISRQCELHPTTGNCVIGDCGRCKLGLLYDAGYRKADEVRRDMIRKMIQMTQDEAGCSFKSIRKRSDTANLTTIDRFVDFIEIISEEFGVEVEE